MKGRFILLAAVATWATLASKLQAQEKLLLDPQRTWAIIIGVDDYLHIRDLEHTSSDAQLMYTYLTDPLGLGLMSGRIFLHLSPSKTLGSTTARGVRVRAEQKHTVALSPPPLLSYPVVYDSTVESIKKSLDYILSNANEGDALIFYFAGHGQSHDGKLYLYTLETPDKKGEKPKDDEALALREILEKIIGSEEKRSPLKTAWLIIDSCHAGAGEQDVKTVLRELGQIEAELAARAGVGVQAVGTPQSQTEASQAAPRFFVLFSARDFEEAYEGRLLRNGVFTYYLIRALRGGAFGAYVRQFARPPGRIVAGDLGSYMQSAVGEFLYRTRGLFQSPTFFPELDKVARFETVRFSPLFGISVVVDASVATEARVEATAPYNPTLKIVKMAPCVFSIRELDRTFREIDAYTLRIYPKSLPALTVAVPLTLDAPLSIRVLREGGAIEVRARLGERELEVIKKSETNFVVGSLKEVNHANSNNSSDAQ